MKSSIKNGVNRAKPIDRDLVYKKLNIELFTKRVGEDIDGSVFVYTARCRQLPVEGSGFSEDDALINLKVEVDNFLNQNESIAKDLLGKI